LSPIGNEPQVDSNGDPLVGGKIHTYIVGTSTPTDTFTTSAGTVAQANPIILNARGCPANPIWLAAGQSYKFVITDANDVTLPPTLDGITGINDPAFASTSSQWIALGVTPTYLSATTFSLSGDQTTTLHVGRRIQTNNSGGIIYSSVSASSYSAGTGLTTITVTNDSGTLDAGLSSVSYGIVSLDNTAIPSPYLKVLRGYLAGLTMSTAGSSATMSVAAGQCSDSANAVTIALASAIGKTTSAWAVGTGNGGLDTGAIANSTWYHFYVIRRPDTGVVDVVCSTNATTPTLPANYTQYRRIGAGRTNGSAQWTKFVQDGDCFQWDVPTADVAAANPGTSAVTRTLTVPTGVKVLAEIRVNTANTATAGVAYTAITDLATSDVVAAAGTSESPGAYNGAAGSSNSSVRLSGIRTNTSAQVRSRLSFSDASVTLSINTLGWMDRRGRDD
jgi:hypothetical protein